MTDTLSQQRLETLLADRYASLAAEPDCDRLEDLSMLLSGHSDESLTADMTGHLQSCDPCSATVIAHATAGGMDRTARPERTIERAPRISAWRSRLQGAAVGALVAALAFLVLRPPARELAPPAQELAPPASTLVPKVAHAPATDRLSVAVKRDEQRWRLVPGERLIAGDTIALFYSTDSAGHLTVVHVDSAGEPTLLAPAGEANAMAMDVGRDVMLADGGVLEDGEGCEWFVAVFSDEPLSVGAVERAVRDAERDDDACVLNAEVPGARALVNLPVRR
ncbi:MAG: hypothetical protein ACI9WU_001980 [Myxococcota bacterium]|jgi:hypothetical protein